MKHLALLLLALPALSQTAPTFRIDGRRLEIVTDRFEVTWEDGNAVRLVNRLGERRELTTAAGMTTGDLPTGMGSFRRVTPKECAQNRVVFSHDLARGAPDWPAQYPPTADSRLEAIPMDGGMRLVYRGLGGDPEAVLQQELSVDAATGELLIRQRASSPHGGVFGISFNLLNLRPEIGFAVPYFGGQRFGGAMPGNGIVGYAWPQFWNAGLIVGEPPEGGSFFVMADDPRLGPKSFMLYRTDTVQGLGFQAGGDAPYDERREVAVCAWRFNTFSGNWVEPAERYRAWLAATYRLQPRPERTTAWFEEIAMTCSAGLNVDQLEQLATRFEPRRVLLVDLGWAEGFNRFAPLYRPRNPESYAAGVKRAHELGYRVGVYTSMKLIDRFANPTMAHDYGVTWKYNGLQEPPPAPPPPRVETDEQHFLAGIHPGSSKWIDFYSGVMVDLQSKYGLDMLYQDVAGGEPGSSGLLDGRTLHEGTVACDRATRAKLPATALAGEFWSEVNVAAGEEMGLGNAMSWFGDSHRLRLARYAHPIQSAIFSGFCTYMSYNTPMQGGANWHYDQNMIEAMGALPTWKGDAREDGPEARVTLERARLLAEGFRPHFPQTGWEPDVIAFLKDDQGRTVRYRRDGLSSSCELDGKLVYARITGRDSWQPAEPIHLDGWLACRDGAPIGLDPEKWYVAFPGPPPATPIVVADLPKGVVVTGTRITDAYSLVSFAGGKPGDRCQWRPGTDRKPVTVADDFPDSLLVGFKAPTALPVDAVLPLDTWQPRVVAGGMAGRASEWRLSPRTWDLGGASHHAWCVSPVIGGRGAEVSIDGYVTLPDEPGLALRFQMGRLGGIGDGVHFVVRVNGHELWRKFSPGLERRWEPAVVPLADYAGKTVILSLAIDCGPSGFNLSCDESLWGEPKLTDALTE